MNRLWKLALVMGLILAPGMAAAQPNSYTYEIFSVDANPTRANGINNQGKVVGTFRDFNVSIHGPNRSFIRESPNVYTKFDVPGYAYSGACGINDVGKIVGWCSNDAITYRAYLKEGETFFVFDVDSGPHDTEALKINNTDVIVGCYKVGNNYRGFIKDTGGIYTLNYGIDTFTYGLNNVGKAVGRFKDNDEVTHGFIMTVWQAGYNTLDFPGALETGAAGINDLGHIVGYYRDDNGEFPFIYINGAYTGLNPTGGTNARAYDINNQGHIVGIIYDAWNTVRGFLATPLNPWIPSMASIYDLLFD